MFISQCRELDARHQAAIFLDSSNLKETKSPTVIEQQGAPQPSRTKPTSDVSEAAELALDEGLDLFAVQGRHDRANALFLARLGELLRKGQGA